MTTANYTSQKSLRSAHEMRFVSPINNLSFDLSRFGDGKIPVRFVYPSVDNQTIYQRPAYQTINPIWSVPLVSLGTGFSQIYGGGYVRTR